MSDDVGYSNVGAYSHGMMVPTPNIDRIAARGHPVHRPLLAPDLHARARRVHHRAAADPHRPHHGGPAGLAGRPGRPRPDAGRRCSSRWATRTGQFGKNHLGDRNSHLPTVHGFDEFFGNLYHLNTEEEPELPEWPKTPGFDQRYRPRGVLDCVATAVDDRTDDGRFGPMGKQRCTDTGR
jgi:hypothetical protein